mgnify:CR=1 FL=1
MSLPRFLSLVWLLVLTLAPADIVHEGVDEGDLVPPIVLVGVACFFYFTGLEMLRRHFRIEIPKSSEILREDARSRRPFWMSHEGL